MVFSWQEEMKEDWDSLRGLQRSEVVLGSSFAGRTDEDPWRGMARVQVVTKLIFDPFTHERKAWPQNVCTLHGHLHKLNTMILSNFECL
jgi:hypothetical protein